MYTLLIVEDEDLIRRGIVQFVPFEQLCISEIYEASNGLEGLQLLQSHKIDLILLDINMPKMNGLDFAKKVKELQPLAKIAIITGYDYFDYAVTALKLGVDDYVMKPVSRKDVSAVLSKLVDKLKNEQVQAEVYETITSFQSKQSASEDNDLKKELSRLIEQNLSNPELSLSFLAGEAGFSSGHMSGVFKRLFTVPFQEYVVTLRLERAKLLLLTSSKKMYEIAEEVGFDNQNYFSTAFKKKYGCSPLQYRERVKDE
ncbi:response regulator transcription factor [Rossellomorea sp. NS-SX7]|uniref:response regulator transcription factor n=1 Tax=Rossellomorea sp. NS-SX7 TaxID=3463856 RepID=UPI00405841A3